jgi:hypothetical protein
MPSCQRLLWTKNDKGRADVFGINIKEYTEVSDHNVPIVQF